MGPGVASLAVFSWVLKSCPWLFFFLHVHLARVSQTVCSPPGWELARVSSSLLVNLLLTSWLTASLFALPPSPAGSGSHFRAPSTRCRMPLLHCCKLSVLTSTAVFYELLLITVLMTPRATSHPSWHRRHGFLASLPALVSNVPRHATLFPGCVTSLHLLVRCVRYQLSRSSTCYRTLQVLCVVCSPLSSPSGSAGPPAAFLRTDSSQHALLRTALVAPPS